MTVDPAGGDPLARTLIAALTARDWRTVRDLFGTVTEPDDRAMLMSVAADVDDVQDWIGEWVAAEPDSTLPLLVRGCHGVFWAWGARGDAKAQYTSEEKFKEFFRRLKMAENCLDEVTDRDPDDTTAWAFLVASARGRQLPPEQAHARFANVVSRHPHHIVAHEHMLQYLCRKWYGSHAEMFAFAREATAKAPKGSLLPELLVVAHIEQWLDLPDGEDAQYLRRPDVRADILTATEQSIFHPEHERRLGWAPRVNTFAMGLHMVGEYEAAARVFDLIGDQVTRWPWQYRAGGPVSAFTAVRADAYARRGPLDTFRGQGLGGVGGDSPVPAR
ncbi:MAG TPA: DUF4034 domain-containing protein [Catenuloplanes sp.]